MRRSLGWRAAFLLTVPLLIGCTPASSAAPMELTVYGAASLRDVLDRVRDVYADAAPGVTLTISTDSSVALRTQIEQGAPADVFLSADTENPAALVDAGLADGDAVSFATNHLAIVVPAGDPADIGDPQGLARDGVAIIAAGERVPITRYAEAAVARLAMLPGYPADFASRYAANIVSREDNVGSVAAKMSLGEGDAGIVYATDAAATSGVETIAIPPEANVVATYSAVVVGASRRQTVARDFLAWLVGPDGRAILADAGFGAPS